MMNFQLTEYESTRDSKLTGYGVDSLAFHPPYFLPNPELLPDAARKIRENPRGFAGVITTMDHYEKEIRSGLDTLMTLIHLHPEFVNSTVLPCKTDSDSDFLQLQEDQIRELVKNHTAVKKKVEYEGTWKGRKLVQIVYPYAGEPLAYFYKQPQTGPSWSDFFRCFADISRFVGSLHAEGYVHGDLSPNNLLYDVHKNDRFIIVDWNKLCRAEDFLQQKKGSVRTGSWSPEHFSLTTERLNGAPQEAYFTIYAEEMRAYLQRMVDFMNFSHATHGRIQTLLGGYLDKSSAMEAMYESLQVVARSQPAVIGFYHDARYFMDTIAKSVHNLFQQKLPEQQACYDGFIALCLVQNLPDRDIYLSDPVRLLDRLTLILEGCANAQNSDQSGPKSVRAEEEILMLLKSQE